MDKTSRGRIEPLKSIYLSTQFTFRGKRCEFESHPLSFVTKPRCSSMIINADLSTWSVLRLSSSTSLGQWLPKPSIKFERLNDVWLLKSFLSLHRDIPALLKVSISFLTHCCWRPVYLYLHTFLHTDYISEYMHLISNYTSQFS